MSSRKMEGRRCLCLTDLFDRMLVPRGVRCGPTFSITRGEKNGRLGGHRVEEQFVGGADEEFQAQHGGAQRRRRRADLGGAQLGLQAPEGL